MHSFNFIRLFVFIFLNRKWLKTTGLTQYKTDFSRFLFCRI